MTIRQIDALQAKERLDSGDGSIYLDVRSEPEFENGHVPGALNIPLMHLDPVTRQMSPNPDFLDVVKAVLPPDARLIVGCMSGARSQKACELMAQAGYAELSNVRGGFGGAKDPIGRLVQPGWMQHGLPVSREAGENSYAAIRSRAKAPGA